MLNALPISAVECAARIARNAFALREVHDVGGAQVRVEVAPPGRVDAGRNSRKA
jgi:hypothetical protein